MNRNVESHFAELPSAEISRSMFDRSAGHKTSFDCGSVIPFFWDSVLPGDTFNVSTSMVVRMQTLLTPIYDNVYVDTYYFFVPSRLVWSHFREFMGENTQSAWIPEAEYSVPQIESPADGWSVGTIADYMGIPVNQPFTKDSGLTVSSLPFRAYALICNEWFRDENVSDPLNIPLGDADQTGSNGDNYITDVVNGGKPFKAAKYHDYFTSCLPSPQKGQAVNMTPSSITFGPGSTVPVSTASGPSVNLSTRFPDIVFGQKVDGRDILFGNGKVSAPGGGQLNQNFQISYEDSTPNTFPESVTKNAGAWPVNLVSSLSDKKLDVSDFGFSINQLRLAFQLQKYYEKLARSGSRYREIILGQFGVHSPDARMMIPEYLGGHRFPLNIHQVENQSQGETDFLGDLGAVSCTSDLNDDFIKSFTEHGYIIGVMVARYDHSYPQGLEREWTRKDKLDFYWPVFANIGEQPVYKYEIDASVRNSDTDERLKVFGYNEAYASYRFKQNRVSGELRPGINNSLAHWHLADYYASTPSLSDGWIREDKTNVDRVLAVTSTVSNQLFADIYVKNIATRPMPMFSVPGLIDHH